MQSHLVLAVLLVSLVGSCYSHECNETRAIQLEGGNVPYEGLVEVCSIYGTHATVGTNYWDKLDAAVVCRELGFPSEGAVAHDVDEWGLEENLWGMWDYVQCDGTEEKLQDCDKREYDFYDSPIVGHAGVRCKDIDRGYTKCKEGTVRLVGGSSMYQGTVEVCVNDQWGTICDDGWDDTDANIVCEQLGFLDWGAQAYGKSHFGAGSQRIHLDDVDCSGSEKELLLCPSRPIGKHNCNATADAAGVVCIVPVDCKDGELRLAVNGKNGYAGRVEICYDRHFGTVCDDSWDDEDARVVCRQLGLGSTGAEAHHEAEHGEGTGRIYLDDVDCDGTEASLLSCRHRGIGVHNCEHHEDASVTCQAPDGCVDGQMRLKNGGSQYEGRVEFCFHEEWGTVCDESFGSLEASVVCQSQGYLWKGAKFIGGAAFGQGEDPIYLDGLECTGKESSLQDCSYSALYNTHGCSHSQDVGVVCQVPQQDHVCQPGAVRLVHGSELEGTVEVCIGNAWGTVCDDSWDDDDAKVVCGQLGHLTTRATAYSRAHFGEGSGDIHLDDLNCEGSEPSLLFCEHGGIENHNCQHNKDAGVTCYERQVCTNGDLRLVDGETSNTGTVQICMDEDWGTVCDDHWDVNDAVVVCRQLGYLTEGAIAYTGDHFGGEREPIFLDDVRCTGTEERLLSCETEPLGSHNCRGYENAGVFCNVRCTPGDIRLVDGPVDYEGRVEYCNDLGDWGNICGYSWNETEAAVACHQLGYPRQGAVPFDGTDFGQSSREVFLIDVTCTGSENSLDECVFGGQGSGDMMPPTDCNYVGIRCMANVTGDDCDDGDIRLVDGTCEPEGRVEICIGDTWGTVCSDNWDDDDAKVVCDELGYTLAIPKAYTGGHFGSCTRDYFLADVQCTGSEAKLFSCQSNPIKAHDCQYNNDAGVSCREPEMCSDGDVQLVSSSMSADEGRVDICVGREWGTVCDDSWDNIDAMVVCSQLDFSRWGAEAVGSARLGQGTCGIFLDDLMCTGKEGNLLQCAHSGIGEHNCQHSEDAGVRCQEKVCTHGEIKLVGGGVVYEGRVEYCDDGAWGTICDDGWTAKDAEVVCAMLNHPKEGAVAFPGSTFGAGSGYIFYGDVACDGSEASLDDCSSTIAPSCSHSEDAGVRCIANVPNSVCNDGDVRIVDENGLTTQTEGRVEICINNTWGTVCDDYWDAMDAAVVCSQLGFSKIGAVAYPRAHFNPGTGGIFLDNVACTGHETSLLSCPSLPIFSNDCQHSEDAGVSCLEKVCEPGTIKLVNGGVNYEGRVEYCNDGVWGTVCDDRWTTEDAEVVCAVLGHPREGAVAFVGAAFGQGTGRIVLTDVECTGTEDSLDSCKNSFTPSCSHSEDAGVRCIANVHNPVCDDGEVRIVDADGKTCGPNGRVEICFNNTWGTVCDRYWDQDDASVVCGQLGFSTEDAVARYNAYYNPGTGPVYLDNVRCSGTESSLLSCVSSPIHSSTCDHADDAGVSCQRAPDMTPTEMCEHGNIKLVSGSVKSEGTVQLCFNNSWGTVCDDYWDDTDAQVVCTQLGYSAQGARAYSSAHFGQGIGEILLDDVACTGTEQDLLVCPALEIGSHNCQHNEDAGVSCVEKPAGGFQEGQLRLVGGGNCAEGRVEVFYNNEWGTVCDDDWDNNDAKVVCSQLGYPSTGAQAVGQAEFGQGTGKIFLDDVMCLGNESTLLSCKFPGIDLHNCLHSEDAGVRCTAPVNYCTHGDLRLVGGSKEGEGRVEICIDNEWGTVCDDSWGTSEAEVVCSQLGYEAEGAKAFGQAHFGRGTCSIFLDEISCTGTEDSLLSCAHNDVSCHNCLHSEDAGVECVVEKPCYLDVLHTEIMGDRLTVEYNRVGEVGSVQCVLNPSPDVDPDYIDCNDSPVVMRLDAGVYRVEIVALGCDPVYKDTLIFRSI